MARRRMIDPMLWDDEDVGGLSDGAFRLFIACISNADDDGKIEASARRLMGIAFRFRDDIRIDDVAGYRAEMCSALRSVHYYTVDGKEYIKFLKWHNWQTIKKAYPSIIPDPEVIDAPPVENQCGTGGEPVEPQGGTDTPVGQTGGGTDGEPVENQCGNPLHEGKRREENIGEEKRAHESPQPVQIVLVDDPCLLVLKEIPNYPYDISKDSAHLDKLRAEFPCADALKVCKEYQTWLLDNPINPKKIGNPRSRLRRFFENAHNWNKERGISPPPRQPTPPEHTGVGITDADIEYVSLHGLSPEEAAELDNTDNLPEPMLRKLEELKRGIRERAKDTAAKSRS